MRRLLRYLRIAFSSTCLIACLLLIALWARSYSWLDVLKIKPPDLQWSASSVNGQLVFDKSTAPWNDWYPLGSWELKSEEDNERTSLWPLQLDPQYSQFNIRFSHIQRIQERILGSGGSQNDYLYLVLPHYYPVALAALTAAIPWLPWSKRFSLRTLLIAMTLVAAGLGEYVWLRELKPAESKTELREVRAKMADEPIDREPYAWTTPQFVKPPTNGTLSGGLNP